MNGNAMMEAGRQGGMMDYGMMGGFGGGLFALLLLVVLGLLIAALIKYLRS